jgi:hypothetical protein
LSHFFLQISIIGDVPVPFFNRLLDPGLRGEQQVAGNLPVVLAGL